VSWLQPAKGKTDVTGHQCLASPPVVKTRIRFPVQIAQILHQLENGEKQAGRVSVILHWNSGLIEVIHFYRVKYQETYAYGDSENPQC
jgi:hypothetical protein